jgi:hypothetical protein
MKEITVKKIFAWGMLFFWGVLFLIAALSNVCDILVYHQILPSYIRFHSGQLETIYQAGQIYGLGMGAASILLFLLSLYQLLIADSFFMALFAWSTSKDKLKFWSSVAFCLSIGLVMLLLLLSEILVFHRLNSLFLSLMIVFLVSWQWFLTNIKK